MLIRFPSRVLSAADLPALQLEGLKWTVRHAWDNSPLYRQRFEAAAIRPEEILSLDDLRRLPFTTAQDLTDGYPFAMRAVPFNDIVRIHASSGTTGKRKVLCYTGKDLEDWQTMFARCYELAGLTREDGSVPNAGRVLLVDSVAAVFSWLVKNSAPWPYLTGPAIWRCRSPFSRISRRLFSAVQLPWGCFWRKKYIALASKRR